MSVTHDTLTVTRIYAASRQRTFAAWADAELKARWFASEEGWLELERSLDFREGGSELWHGRAPTGQKHRYLARYEDIVTPRRIIFTYSMTVDGRRLSVSLATVELAAQGSGTRLTLTEQATFLDGLDDPQTRARGFGAHLDRLGRLLDDAGTDRSNR